MKDCLQGKSDLTERGLFAYLSPREAVYGGRVAQTVDFVMAKQLKDKALWKKFANQFRVRLDSDDLGWRGEYWGKMMRGGCLTYAYSGDEELYAALTFAVEELLKTQDALGRISSYTVETEFSGWDMWCRKYVLTGLQHFYKICKDEDLKARALCAMKSTADYICENIGEGKKDIRTTSHIWGGVNSCSILEPFVELYKLTKIEKYLQFAKYIIDGGGCADGNLLDSVAKDGVYPYQYPVVKAYETISFFEGLLAYYEVTGEEKYCNLVKKFVEDAYETERTVIGGIGGREELFDHFYLHQTEAQPTIVQETCVTVTWMRMLVRLYFQTGDVKYADRFERSAYNALWGSLNTEWNTHYSSVVKRQVAALPFDSYSPLTYDKRGREVGGFRIMEDGSNYGCCVAIGAAGIALTPLFATLREKGGLVVNFYFDGTVATETPLGKKLKLTISGASSASGKIKVSIACEAEERFKLRFRKPYWCAKASVRGVDCIEKDGYFIIDKVWVEKEEFVLELPMRLQEEKLNGKTAFTYGPFVLALDEAKGNRNIDKEIVLSGEGELETPMPTEMVRYRFKKENGEDLIFTDYASSGKAWANSEDKISVWLNVR